MFWRGLERGVVQVPRCTGCDAWVWPARPGCPHCGSGDLDWTPVEPTGRVFSWTRVWYPFVPERADSLPYVVAVVELDVAPEVRMLGIFDGVDDQVHIGAAVAATIAAPTAPTLGLPSLRWSRLDEGTADG